MNIKIACPNNTVTGGIELLHQVACELNKYENVNATIWYINAPNDTTIPHDYLQYDNKLSTEIHSDDILIFPEIWGHYTNRPQFKNNKKLIYWESVDNYFPHTPESEWFKFADNTIHISQTEYSTRFLKDVLKIPARNIIEITDYVNDSYLNFKEDGTKRERIVVYNPSKGLQYTNKLIALMHHDVKFVPIKNMSREQIIDTMRHSMVFIDFGYFPGKDRLPREAAMCGLCLVTCKQGSARYVKDLNIPNSYKIDNLNYADLGFIEVQIHDIMDNFEEHSKMFDQYRSWVKQEKYMFQQGIKKLIERLNNEI